MTFQIYTVQLKNARLAELYDASLLDTTAKSGDEVFAPKWDYVWKYKTGRMNSENYIRLYKADLEESQRKHPQRWNEVLSQPDLALGCYCSPEAAFCHRWYLRDYLIALHHQRGEDAVNAGELTP